MELVEMNLDFVVEEVVEQGLLEAMVQLEQHVCIMEAMESSPTSQAV